MFVKKHDQEGKDCKPKHVFTNPVKPVYIFTIGPWRPGAKMLEALCAMGIMISHIGTHSFSKGTATWLAGMVDGPSG
eukprot:976191-Rhodomonas_salina.1